MAKKWLEFKKSTLPKVKNFKLLCEKIRVLSKFNDSKTVFACEFRREIGFLELKIAKMCYMISKIKKNAQLIVFFNFWFSRRKNSHKIMCLMNESNFLLAHYKK